MRSHPSCWNKTLAQLGFRRKRRKAPKHDQLRRRSLFEALEQRQMLSGDPLLDPAAEEPIQFFASGPEFQLLQPEMPVEDFLSLTEEERAEVETVFLIDTVQTESGPKAIISFNPNSAVGPPAGLQRLQLELQQNGRVIDTYEILIDIAEESFREQFLADRIANIEVNSDVRTLSEAREATTRPITADELAQEVAFWDTFIGPKTLEQQQRFNAAMDGTLRVAVEHTDLTTDDLVSIAKSDSFQRARVLGNATQTTLERKQIYNEVEKQTAQLKQDRLAVTTDVEREAVAKQERSLQNLALALAKNLREDLNSTDATLAQSAQKVRDELVAISDPMDILFAGLNVDNEVERATNIQGDEKALSFVETGRYVFDNQLEIDLGEHQAMVQVTRLGNFRLAAATSISESPAVEDGFFRESTPTAMNAGGNRLRAIGTPNDNQESLIRFDLGQFAGLSDPTTIASAVLELTELGTGVGNAEVYAWNGLLDGGADSVTDWDETNLRWDRIHGSHDFDSKLGEFTRLNNWEGGTTTSIDVTSHVQRALLFGDANGDGVFGAAGSDGDIEAFHLAVTNWDAYVAEYGPRANSASDLLARTDGGLGDGTIDTGDIADFFRRHGFSQGDYNLDGTVQDNEDSGLDGLDWATWHANYGLENARFTQGDGNFDGVIDDLDYNIWLSRTSEDNLTAEEPEIIVWVRPEDSTTNIKFASQEHATQDGPTLVVTEQPDLALNKFSVDGSNLVVDYAVLGDTFTDVKVQLYKVGSPDTLLHETAVQSGALGTHEVLIATSVLSSIVEGDSIYAKVVGTPASGTQSNLLNDQLDFEFSTDSTQTVNSLDDAGMDTLLRDKHTLRELIEADESLGWFDTLALDDSLFGQGQKTIVLGDHSGDLVADRLDIYNDLTISGPGQKRLAIDARNQSMGIVVQTAAQVTFSDLTITGGYALGHGAGIYNKGDLTIDGVTVADSNAQSHGGGIYNLTGSTLDIQRSTIDGNSAHYGSGISGFFPVGQSLTINQSTISNNSSASHSGGLSIVGTPGATTTEVLITNSTFSGNASGTTAGAIRAQTNTDLKIVHSTIAENDAVSSAGGIYSHTGATTTLHNTILADNSIEGTAVWATDASGDIGGTTLEPSTGNLIGIGQSGHQMDDVINQVGTTTTPIDPMLDELKSYGLHAAAHVPLPGSPAIDRGDDSLTMSYGAQQSQSGVSQWGDTPGAGTPGGFSDVGSAAVYAGHMTEVVTIDGQEVAAVTELTATPTQIRVDLSNDELDRDLVDYQDYNAGDPDISLREALEIAKQPGNHIITFDASLTGETFTLNRDSEELVISQDTNIIGLGVDQQTIDADASADDMRSVFRVESGVTASIEGLTITGGNSRRGGGINNAGNLMLDHVRIERNTADLGGGIYLADSGPVSLNLTNSTIDDNSARLGGGLYSAASSGSIDIDIVGSTFSRNRAETDSPGSSAEGGAMYLANAPTFELDVSNSTFSGNEAEYAGGGIHLTLAALPTGSDAVVALTNVTVAENKLTGSGGGGGAGIHLYGFNSNPEGDPANLDSVELHNSIVARNTKNGGANHDDIFESGGVLAQTSSYNLIGNANTAGGLEDKLHKPAYHNIVGDDGEVGTTIDPGLSALGNYGGPTWTHQLEANSPAIDGGGDVAVYTKELDSDQRGATYLRIVDADNDQGSNNVDIGAYELSLLDLDTTSNGSNTVVDFIVGEGPVLIAPNAQFAGVADAMTVTFKGLPPYHYEHGTDILLSSYTNPAITIEHLSGQIKLTGAATAAEYQDALRQITFESVEVDPNPTPRQMQIDAFLDARRISSATATIQPKYRGTITYHGIEDASVWGGSDPSGRDNPESRYLYVEDASENTAYIKFPLPHQVTDVTHAAVSLYTKDIVPSSTSTVDIYAFHDDWSESHPPGHLLDTAGISSIGQYLADPYSHDTVDVTDAIRAELDAPDGYFSIALVDHNAAANVTTISSSETVRSAEVPRLTVTGLFTNRPPIAASDIYFRELSDRQALVRIPASEGVLSNDMDLDGAAASSLRAVLERPPLYGEVSLRPDGSFFYVADDGSYPFFTEDSFTYRAFDGVSYSDPTTVTIQERTITGEERHYGVFSMTSYSYPPDVDSHPEKNYINAPFSLASGHACSDWLQRDYDGYGGAFGIDYENGAAPGHLNELTYRIDDLLNTVSDPVAEIGRATIELGLEGTNGSYADAYGRLIEIALASGTPLPPVFPYSCLGDNQFWDTAPTGMSWEPIDESWGIPSSAISQSSGAWNNDFESHPFNNRVDVTEYLRAAISEGDSTISIEVRGSTPWTTHLQAGDLTVVLTTEPGSPADPTPKPNYLPYFTSNADGEVTIGDTFEYQMAASDPDDDIAELGLPTTSIIWPAGFTPGPDELPTFTPIAGANKADVRWTPPVELVGETITFAEFVRDDFGHLVSRSFDVYVKQDPQNQPPVIIAAPTREFVLPETVGSFVDNGVAVSPDFIDIYLAEGQKEQIDITAAISSSDLRSEIVFVVDSTGSMADGFTWIKHVMLGLDEALEERGFADGNRRYGLATFNDLDGTKLYDNFSEGYWGTAAEIEIEADVLKSFVSGDGEYGYHALGEVLGIDNGGASPYNFNANVPGTTQDPRLTSSQIVLITDDSVQGFETPNPADGKLEREAYRDTLSDLLQGGPGTFDDILLTTIVDARHQATVEQGRPAGFQEISGTWTLGPQGYSASVANANDWAISVADAYLDHSYLHAGRQKNIVVPLEIQDEGQGDGNAFVVFNYHDEFDFKFVAAFASESGSDEWRIGYRDAFGVEYGPPIYSSEGVDFDTRYNVNVQLGVDTVELSVNGESLGVHKFSGLPGPKFDQPSLYEGHVGVGTLGASAQFFGLAVTPEENAEITVPPKRYIYENLRHVFGTEGTAFPVLGHSALGTAYIPEAGGQFSKGELSSTVYSHFNIDHNGSDTYQDYISLATEAGGSVWDQSLLRSIKDDPNSNIAVVFSNAFSEALVEQTLRNMGPIELSSDVPSLVSLTSIDDPSNEVGNNSFVASFEGDGASHFFQLGLEQNGMPIGQIPTRILAPYVADFDANDPDGPPDLEFSWAQGSWTTTDEDHKPQLISSGRDGIVNDRMIWQPPTINVSQYPNGQEFRFGITVHDGLKLEAVEEFWWTVTVKPPADNTPPEIDGFYPIEDGNAASTPPSGQVGVGYSIQVAAHDDDGDRLRYFIEDTPTPPDNMVIDPNTGEIFWVPTETGSFDVKVRVSDGRVTALPNTPLPGKTSYRPDEATHTFSITVDPRTFSNFAPSLSPIPSGYIYVGQTLSYPTTASDPNGHKLQYDLDGEPDWMSITDKGVITGTPTHSDINTLSTVTVIVDDGQGKQDSETFQIAVLTSNRKPIFDSKPHNAGKDLDFAYRLEAHDPDGDSIRFYLDDPPSQMELDTRADGVYVVWNREDMTEGNHFIRILADDGKGGIEDQEFNLEVLPVAAPVFSGIIPTRVTIDSAVADEYVAEFSLTSGVPIPDLANQVASQTNVTLDARSRARGMSINVENVAESQQADTSYRYDGIRLIWDPSYADVFEVEISASNGFADSSLPFTVEVFPEVSINNGPLIRSDALGPFAVGETFDFQLAIEDPNGHDIFDVVVLAETTAPGFDSANVNYNGEPGRIHWTPTESGDYVLVLRARDFANANEPLDSTNILAQPVIIPVHVSPNAPTKISTGPVNFPPFFGQRFSHPFTVADANAEDTITVSLNDEALAAGLRVQETATPGEWELVWQSPSPIGSQIFVRVEATDGRGTLSAFSFELTVFDPESEAAPLQPSGIGPFDVPFGRELRHGVLAAGAGYIPPTFSIQSTGGPAPDNLPTISSNGEIRWTPTFNDTGGLSAPSVQYGFEILIDYNPFITTDNIVVPLTLRAVKPEDFAVTDVAISSTPPITAVTGRLLKYTPETSGGVGQIVWSLGEGTPSDVSVDPNDGTVTWIPNSDDLGSATTIYLLATDALQQSSIQEISLEVVGEGMLPQIESSFPSLWPILRDFNFPVDARHPNGGRLGYRLLELSGDPIPDGTWTIDATGVIRWSDPLEGQYHFLIEVFDRDIPELFNRQQVSIDVDGADSYVAKPIIQDLPYGRVASAGSQFEHSLSVWDPDGVVNTWDIVSGQPPAGQPQVAIDDAGSITWTADSEQVGESFSLKVRASDGQPGGYEAFADFDLRAIANDAPIVTLPVLTPTVGTELLYTVTARDPEGGDLTYRIESAPSGLTINEQTGLLHWSVPTSVPAPLPTFDLIVSDEHGLETTTSVSINVQPDTEAPTVNFWIEDGNGDVVPLGSTLDSNLVDDYKIWFTIEDNLGEGLGEMNWLLQVVDSAGLNIEGNENFKTSSTRGGTASTSFQDTLNSGLLFFTFTLGDADTVAIVPGDPDEGVLPDDITGNVATYTFRYDVSNSTQETYAQLLNVDHPDEMLVVDERFEVRGIANYEISQNDYAWYDLKLASVDDPNDFVYLIRNASAEFDTDSVIGVIDPTLVRSGQYRLYLEVRSTQNENCLCIAGIDEQIIEVRNESRLGNLDLSFTDLSVDLGGIPISLVRSYSSSLVGEGDVALGGDFGPGWTLNFLQSGIEVGHPDQTTTNLNEPFADRTRLLVELPDGSIHRFEFDVEEVGNSDTGPFRPLFRPDPDVTSTLELADQDDSLLLIPNSLRQDGSFVSSDSNREFLPANFGTSIVLTTQGGLRYLFDTRSGRLIAIQDTNDRRVTVTRDETNNQVVIAAENTSASASEEVIIQFDAEGRIESIDDPVQQSPVNKTINYYYGEFDPATGNTTVPGAENLGKVVMRNDDRIVYRYANAIYQRHLTNIYDNAGVNVLTVSYYDDISQVQDPPGQSLTDEQKKTYLGRLWDLQDASGQGADVSFDIDLGDGRMVTRVDNGFGIEVDEVTNNRGNVLRRVQLIDTGVIGDGSDAEYLVTKYEFNNRGLLTHQSVPYVVEDIANRYESPNDPVSDPDDTNYDRARWAQIITYDQNDRTHTSSDALGNTTTFKYDDDDRIVETTDPNGFVTHNVYDHYTGNLLETYVTEGEGTQKHNHSKFVYDDVYGRLTETYQVDGTNELLISKTSYDSDTGRVDWTQQADLKEGVDGVKQYFGYDANGNQTHSWSNWTNGVSSYALLSLTVLDDEGRVERTEEYELTGNYTDFDSLPNLATISALWTTHTEYDDQGRVDRSIDRYGNVSKTVYDIRGNVIESRTESKDKNDNVGWLVTRTLYDDQGRVLFSADPYFSFGAGDPAATSPSLFGSYTHYDALGRADRTERHGGVVIELRDDDQDGIPEPTDSDGILGAYTGYDFTDAVTNPPISVSSTHYDSIGRVNHTISETDARTDYYYDATGRQIATLGPIVTVSEIQQRLLSISDFDAGGRLRQSTTGIAITETSPGNLHPSLNDLLNPQWTERDDTARQDTFYEYDAAGRQTAVITTAFDNPDYDDNGPIGEFDTVHGRIHLRTETVYDGFGRRIASIVGIKQADPLVATTIERTHQRETNYEYDDAGNLTAVILPAVEHPVTSTMVRPRYEYTYDIYGNRLTIRDNVYVEPATGDIYYEHGGTANDFTADYDTRVTTFEYDHRGQQTLRTLPQSQSESMHFSSTALNQASPDDRVSGQLEHSVSFEGKVTAYYYDNTEQGGGRLIETRYYGTLLDYQTNEANPAETVSYEYDEFGRQVEINDSTRDVTTNTYDPEGRLTRVDSPEGIVNYEYDSVTSQITHTWTGNLDSSNRSTSATWTEYVYDDLNRLEQVISHRAAGQPVVVGDSTTVYFYDLLGNLARTQLANGLVTDYAYDELNRLVRMVNYLDGVIDSNPDGTFDRDVNGDFDLSSISDRLRSSYEYAIDLFHKRTSATEIINTGADNLAVKTTQLDWEYDALGRLTSEKYDYEPSATPSDDDFWAEYDFDLVGNRLEKRLDEDYLGNAGVDETITYRYNDNDHLEREQKDVTVGTANDTTTFYGYDETQRISKHVYGQIHTNEPGSGKINETTFAYNLQGRMKSATVDTDGDGTTESPVTTTYEYDDSGIRVTQQVGTADKTIYVVDKNNPTGYAQVLEEGADTDGEGDLDASEVDKSYVIGHDVIAQAVPDVVNAVMQYLMYDGHGSTRAMLNDVADVITAGGEQQLFAYDAYGNLEGPNTVFVQAITDAITSLLYSGEQTDRSTGLQYLRARFYDPSIGGFNRLDPFAGDFEDPQSLHKYLYTHGDPVNGVDPSGLLLSALAGAIGRALLVGGIGGAISGAFAGVGANQLGFSKSESFSLGVQFGTANAIILGRTSLKASATGGASLLDGDLVQNITFPTFNALTAALTSVALDIVTNRFGSEPQISSDEMVRNGYRVFIQTYFDVAMVNLFRVNLGVRESVAFSLVPNINNVFNMLGGILSANGQEEVLDRFVDGMIDVALGVSIGTLFSKDVTGGFAAFPTKTPGMRRIIQKMHTVLEKVDWSQDQVELAIRLQFRIHAKRAIKQVLSMFETDV